MATPAHLRSSFVTVLNAVAAQLALEVSLSDELTLPAARVRFVAKRRDNQLPPLDGDRDVLLRDRGFSVVGGIEDRHDHRIFRRLGVLLRTRNELGEGDSDDAWAKHATLGNIVWEEAVLNALQNFLPEDDDLNTLLFEPMKLEPGEGRVAEGDGWGGVEVVFRVGITLPHDQGRQ